MGNHLRTVSCHYEYHSSHVEQETICEQFPAIMNTIRPTSSRKPFANSFLPSCIPSFSCRIGNLSQTVSCRHGFHHSHVGWETLRRQFPAAMHTIRPMSSRKPFANSFLPSWVPSFSCRIGNLSRTVSCRHGFHILMSDGKPFADSFLPLCIPFLSPHPPFHHVL